MPKRAGNLMPAIASMDNLRLALHKTSKGKRHSFGHLEFKEYAHANLARLREQLLDGGWHQSAPREFWVYEPKPRLISALPFKDRVAQHALVNIIGPLFDQALLPYAFACRDGLGTHAGVRHVQAALRHTQATHFLKTDWAKFFPSICRARLHALIHRRIKCPATLALIERMVPATGRGLPIGCLTSQLFANAYGGQMDRFVHTELGARHWARYMDDIVIVSRNPYELRCWQEQMQVFSEEHLDLRFSKWQVSPVQRAINFLGFRIWPRHKLLRKASVTRAKRTISQHQRHQRDEELGRFLGAWRGHAMHADTCNLFNHLEKKYHVAIH